MVVASARNKNSGVYDARVKQLEDERLAKTVEMRLEEQEAQKAEQRLRVDRDEWKLMGTFT